MKEEENSEKKSEQLIKRVNLDFQNCKLVEYFLSNRVYS